MAQIVDSYSETNGDTEWQSGSTYSKESQSFTGDGGTLDTVKFYLTREGTSTGTVIAVIYAHSGTFGSSSVPTGSVLATSDSLDISTFETHPTFSLQTFTFSGADKITLTNGTKYCVVYVFSPTTGYIRTKADGNADGHSPTHGGNLAEWNGSSWDIYSDYDLPFYVYRDDGSASASISASPSVSPSVSISASPSASPSPSSSISKSPSVSPSISISASPSVSISASPSVSVSKSPSASPSVSISKSPSTSPSVSPSTSPPPIQYIEDVTLRFAGSASPSASPSVSPSSSISASVSKSLSASPSVSKSASPSVSPSASPSPSSALEHIQDVIGGFNIIVFPR